MEPPFDARPDATPPDAMVVWIVDADHWPRAALRAELIERGYDAVGFVHLEDALARLVRPEANPPRVLMLEADGQTITERQLELLDRRRVPVALTGGTVALEAPIWRKQTERGTFRPAVVLPRPIRIGELADTVGSLLRPLR